MTKNAQITSKPSYAPCQPSEEDEVEEEEEVVQEEDMPETLIPRPTEFGNAIIAYATATLDGNPVDVLAHLIRKKNVPSQTQRG